jgi:regulatory protein
MSKITAITPQKKDKNRVNIDIDGKFSFGLDLESLVKEKLKIGYELDEKEIERLKNLNETGLLQSQVISLLSRRPHSKREITQYLQKKHATDKQKEIIVQKLENLNYINDEEFVVWWIDQRKTFRPKGKIAIFQELRQKGVDEKLIKSVFGKSEEKKENSDFSVALELGKKRYERVKNLPEMEVKTKLSRFLAGRGFEWEIIKDVIDSLLKKE